MSCSVNFFLILFFCLVVQLVEGQVILEESNLPIVIINTDGRVISDEPKVESTMKIINNPSGINSINDPVNGYNGKIGIEYRGSSSQFFFDKKNFGIELWTESGADTSAVILGMPAEEDWVLHGPYSDKTLLRNALTFHLWSETGRYGARTRFCEVVLDDQYIGLYIMMEKIKRDKERVDVSKLKTDENTGDDLTGGYIVKIDKFDGTNSNEGWTSPYIPPGKVRDDQVIFFQFDYPKGRNITDEQAQYIESYVTEFENALFGPDFKNPVTGYRNFADIETFVDFALLNEVNKNVDGYRLSTFLHKDKDSSGGKLKIGPIWDFNLAFGNADYCKGGNTDGWAWDFNTHCRDDFWLIPFWWNRLLRDPEFVSSLKSRWKFLREDKFSTERILDYIDSASSKMDLAIQRNFQKWPILDTYIWPNNFVGDGNYSSDVNYLKDWITDRLGWIDDNILLIEAPAVTVGISETELQFKLYPNPSTNKLSVESIKVIESIEVLSLGGDRLVFKKGKETSSLNFDTSALPTGTYILSATHLGGEVVTSTFLKR